MTTADKKPSDAFAYLLSSPQEGSKLMRIATLSDLQIGLPDSPAELQVTGRFSQSVGFVQVDPGQTISYPDDITVLLVSILPLEIVKSGIAYENLNLGSQQVEVILPENPRIGQVCYVKDGSNTADRCHIKIGAFGKLDDLEEKIIKAKNGCVSFIWSGTTWAVLSDTSSTPEQESGTALKKIAEDAIENYGAASSNASYVVLSSDASLTNERILKAGSNITITDGGPGGDITISSAGGGGGGSGDVVGPASSTTNAVAKYADTTGKLLSNTSVTIDSSNNVTVPGRIIVTGGTTSATDATLGNAAVGSFPYYDGGGSSGVFAMIGHKDLDHSTAVTNYALYQDNTGNTSINASNGKVLYFAINNVALGAITNDYLTTGIDAILFTGDISTRTDVTLGNTTGASATTIYAGTGDLNIGENAASRTVNLGTGNNTTEQEVTAGSTFGRSPLVLRAGTGNMYLTGAVSTDFIIGHTAGTGGIAVGRSTASNTINIGNSGNNASNTQTVNIAAGTGRSVVTIGSTAGTSSTSIKAGSGGITLSGSGGQTVITGSSTTYTDALIGAWEIGSLPATQGAFPNAFAFIGHKDLDHSTDGNYSLVQSNAGDTFLGAASTKDIYFKNGTNVVGQLSNDTVSFTGQTGTAVTTTLGNSFGVSYTNINAGTFGITLSGSSTTTITGSTSTNAEAHIGTAELGELPYTKISFPNYFAMFGHKTLDHSVNGNYALVQSYDGDTFLNAASTKSIYLQNAGNLIGTLDENTVSLTGQANTAVATTIGNSYGVSTTNINAGLFGITLSGSSTTTITGSSSTNAEAHIGVVEIGELPYTRTSFPSYFAMFGHKTLDHSVNGNYSLVQSYDGDTFLNSATTKSIYFQNAGNLIGTLDNNTISLTGQANTAVSTTLGNSFGVSTTDIYAGLFGITLSGSATTTITGSSSTSAEVHIGTVEIGELPYTRTSSPGTFAMFGHKALDNSVDGNYALVQSGVGDTFLGAASGRSITIKNGTSTLGTLSTFFTTLSGSLFATLTGNATSINGNNSLSLYAGSGGITLSGSGAATSITGSTSSLAEAFIGTVEIGELPWSKTSLPGIYAMFGHKALDHTSLNYALVQSNTGDTFLNAASGKSVFIANNGTAIAQVDTNVTTFTGSLTTRITGNSTTISGSNSLTLMSNANGGVLKLSGTYVTITGSIGINLPSGRTPNRSGIHIKQSSDPSRSGTAVTDNGAALRIEDDDGDGWIIGAGTDNHLWFSWDFSSVGGDGGASTVQGYINSAANAFTLMNFTGQHRCVPALGTVESFDEKSGLIVVASGDYLNPVSGSTTGSYNRNIGINDATPTVQLASARNDKRAFGIVSMIEDVSDGAREFSVGKFVSVLGSGGQEDNRIFVNAIGEGAIWVCNVNGNLENGDYITTCEIPGYGMKQDDDLLHNYTVAKITCDCNFTLDNGFYQCEEFQHEGITYRRAFVGCTYHCG